MINYTWWMFGMFDECAIHTCNISFKYVELGVFCLPLFGWNFFVVCECVCCMTYASDDWRVPERIECSELRCRLLNVRATDQQVVIEHILANPFENMDYKIQFIIFDRFFVHGFVHKSDCKKNNLKRRTNMHGKIEMWKLLLAIKHKKSILNSNDFDEWHWYLIFSFISCWKHSFSNTPTLHVSKRDDAKCYNYWCCYRSECLHFKRILVLNGDSFDNNHFRKDNYRATL